MVQPIGITPELIRALSRRVRLDPRAMNVPPPISTFPATPGALTLLRPRRLGAGRKNHNAIKFRTGTSARKLCHPLKPMQPRIFAIGISSIAK